MSATSLLSLPVELLLEICTISDHLPDPAPEQTPAPVSPGFFQLPPMLTPGSAAFTPLGRIAGAGAVNGGDYFGTTGRGAEGFVLRNGREVDQLSMAGSRRGSAINHAATAGTEVDSNNFLHPEDRRGSQDLLGLGNYDSRSATASASLQPSVFEQAGEDRTTGRKTLGILSEVCNELRETLWPLLLGTITLDLRKVREILASPARDTFSQTVRHLQLNLYPNDPTSLDDISTFLSIVHSHLYSLQFRFHPLPRSSTVQSLEGRGKASGVSSTINRGLNDHRSGALEDSEPTQPHRKVFHLPYVDGCGDDDGADDEPVFFHLQTLQFKGFGCISNLETAILQQAPNLSTLDIACNPIGLSRAFDIVESLKTSCSSLENLRMEIDLGAKAPALDGDRSVIKEKELRREVWSFINKIFLSSSGDHGRARNHVDSAKRNRGSLGALRTVDILCKDLACQISCRDWESLVKLIVDNAPQLRALKLPINPGLCQTTPTEDAEGSENAEKRRMAEEKILQGLLALDPTSKIDGRGTSGGLLPCRRHEESDPRSGTGENPITETATDRQPPASKLEHLEYLEFKLDSIQKQTIIDPLIHTDDHPFHSRILPPDQKVDQDPGRVGRFVLGASVFPRPVDGATEEDHISLRPTGPAELGLPTSTWRWESSGRLMECEYYRVWFTTIDRHPPTRRPSGVTQNGTDIPLEDVDMDPRVVSVSKQVYGEESMHIATNESGHHRW